MRPKSFRPMLEVLEGRIVPSSMAKTLGREVADGQLTLSQAVALGDVKVPPIATIDFSPFAGVHRATTVEVAINTKISKDRGARILIPKVDVAATTTASPLNARRVALDVYNAMPISTIGADGKRTAGFDASLDSVLPVITIRGYYSSKGKFREINKPLLADPGKGAVAPDVDFKRSRTYAEGDDTASLPTHQAVAFSFRPNLDDHNATLQENTVVQGDIDGVVFSVNELAGESYLQVASDVAAALTNLGLQGVSTDGRGDVVFMNDFAGQTASELGITLVGSGTDSSPGTGIAVSVGSHRPVA